MKVVITPAMLGKYAKGYPNDAAPVIQEIIDGSPRDHGSRSIIFDLPEDPKAKFDMWLGQSIRVDKMIFMRGEPVVDTQRVIFTVGGDFPAIIVDDLATSRYGTSGRYSVLEGFNFQGHEPWPRGPNARRHQHGILARAGCRVQLVTGGNLGGDLIFFTSETPDAPNGLPHTNCNVWTANIISAWLCRSGIHTRGKDCNAGHAFNLDFNDCEIGIWEQSGIGDHYIGGHIEGCLESGRVESPSARTALIGVYLEGGPFFSGSGGFYYAGAIANCEFVGPNGGPAWGDINTDGVFVNGHAFRLDSKYPRRRVRIDVGGMGDHNILSLRPEDKLGVPLPTHWQPYHLKFGNNVQSGGYHDVVGWYKGNGGMPPAIWLPTSTSELGNGHVPEAWEAGAWKWHIGGVGMDSGASLPTMDGWPKGWIRWNSEPAIGSPWMWRCVQSGQYGQYTEGRKAKSIGGNELILDGPSTVLVPGMWITVNGITTRIQRQRDWDGDVVYQVWQHVKRGPWIYRCTVAGWVGHEWPKDSSNQDVHALEVQDGSVTWLQVGLSDRTLVTYNTIWSGDDLAISFTPPIWESK